MQVVFVLWADCCALSSQLRATTHLVLSLLFFFFLQICMSCFVSHVSLVDNNLFLLKPEWEVRAEAATAPHIWTCQCCWCTSGMGAQKMKSLSAKISGYGELCPPLFSVSPSPAPSLPFAYLSIMHEWTPSQNSFLLQDCFLFLLTNKFIQGKKKKIKHEKQTRRTS